MTKKTILIFGYGYVAQSLAQQLNNFGWIVYCTSRQVDVSNPITNGHTKIINFLDPEVLSIIKITDCILTTVPLNDEMLDPVLQHYYDKITNDSFNWLGYLSTTSVYGNHNGHWVNENSHCLPSNTSSKARLSIEKQWLALYDNHQLPIHIFRLSGIYGPNKNYLTQIKAGKDFTIVKDNQYFSRIHVADIGLAILKSMNSPTPNEIFNLSDNLPSPIHTVQQFAAQQLKHHPLKEIPFEEADLSKRAKYFFNDNKKVCNKKITELLNIQWQYPTYYEGLLNGCNLK